MIIDNILIVGNPESFHVGAHFLKAAKTLGLRSEIKDVKEAFSGSRLVQSVLWRFCGHKPQGLEAYGNDVVAHCKRAGYSAVLSTGIAPLDQNALGQLKNAGIQTLNYLTDDPWNKAHSAPWFLEAIRHYDTVFTTRRSNFSDLRKNDCQNIHYCPFGYDIIAHKLSPGLVTETNGPDIIFVGGADSDRKKILKPLLQNGIKLALYGGYWANSKDFSHYSCGNADLSILARKGQEAKITLCLVRRANRDGHVMRTFEAAASGGCMLVEDSEEHREIFGADGECVVYFSSDAEMVTKAKWLLGHPEERFRLRKAVYKKIVVDGENTYHDRLKFMLQKMGKSEK